MRKQLLVYAAATMIALQGSAQATTFFNTWTTEYDGFGNGHGVLQGLSTNGEYAVGFGGNSQLSIMWSKEGNTLTDIYSYNKDITGHADALCYDVSDAGTVVGSFYALKNIDGYNRYLPFPGYRTIDGEWHNVELLVTDSKKLSGSGNAGKIIKISGDGSIMAGHIQSEDGSKSVPALWNGQGELIKPLIPAPECNFFNMTAMSEDGTVLAGYKMETNFIYEFQTLEGIIYVDGQWIDIPFTGYTGSISHRSVVTSISENGAYACGYTLYRTDDDAISKGFIFNVSQKEFTWIDGIVPSVVTNDGTLYGRTHVDDIMVTAGPATAILYKDGQLKNVKEWLIAEHYLSETETADIAFSDVTGVSEAKDGLFTLVGHTSIATGMHNAEKGCTPFVICIGNEPAREEYITTELGTIADSKQVKVTYFDGVLTLAGAFNSISENGRYLVGGFSGAYTYVYDRQAGTLRKLYCPEYEETVDGVTSTTSSCDGMGISNDGIVAGNYVCKDSIQIIEGVEFACDIAGYYKNKNWYPLERIGGVELTANGFDGAAKAITADGSILGGRIPIQPFKYQACKWSADGKIIALLPGCDNYAGGTVLSLSDDGRVACGWTDDSMRGQPSIWIDNDLFRLNNSEEYIGQATFVSHNGKYVVGQAADAEAEYLYEAKGFIFNVETKEVTFAPFHEGYKGSVITGISEDGQTIVGYSMVGGIINRRPFIIIEGVFYDLDEYVKSLGWEAPTEYENLNFFTPGGVSADGTVIYGICDNDGMRLSYVIELKEAEPISKTIYGHVSYNDVDETGLASFNTIDPTDISIFAPTNLTIQSGVLAGENYYVAGEKASATPWALGEDKPSFMKMSLTTGETITIGTLDALFCFDMTYDYTTGSMYAITSDDGMACSLATLNPENATITKAIELDNTYITLACDFKGNLYSIDIDGNLYKLNKENGSATLVGATGLIPCYGILQTAEFDHDCNILYWIASTNDGNTSNLAMVNTKTGKATVVNTFANNDNIVALCIPSDKVTAVDSPITNHTNVSMSSAIVTGNLYIRGEYTSATVYTTTGTCVISDKQATGSLDFSTLPANIYVVKVINGNQMKTFKVIKK